MGTIAAGEFCSITVSAPTRSSLLVAVSGEVDVRARSELTSVLDRLVDGPPVLLDLSEVTFVDVAGHDAIERALTRGDPVVRLHVSCSSYAWIDRLRRDVS